MLIYCTLLWDSNGGSQCNLFLNRQDAEKQIVTYVMERLQELLEESPEYTAMYDKVMLYINNGEYSDALNEVDGDQYVTIQEVEMKNVILETERYYPTKESIDVETKSARDRAFKSMVEQRPFDDRGLCLTGVKVSEDVYVVRETYTQSAILYCQHDKWAASLWTRFTHAAADNYFAKRFEKLGIEVTVLNRGDFNLVCKEGYDALVRQRVAGE